MWARVAVLTPRAHAACLPCHMHAQLSALVLARLLQSCPRKAGVLRTGHLVGNTEAGGGTAELGMSAKVGVCRTAAATARFKLQAHMRRLSSAGVARSALLAPPPHAAALRLKHRASRLWRSASGRVSSTCSSAQTWALRAWTFGSARCVCVRACVCVCACVRACMHAQGFSRACEWLCLATLRARGQERLQRRGFLRCRHEPAHTPNTQVVVSYEFPANVTSYIQTRGRTRAAGSRHCWLVPRGPESWKVLDKKQQLVWCAAWRACTCGRPAACTSVAVHTIVLTALSRCHHPPKKPTKQGGRAAGGVCRRCVRRRAHAPAAPRPAAAAALHAAAAAPAQPPHHAA
jgi:hypothetical protein